MTEQEAARYDWEIGPSDDEVFAEQEAREHAASCYCGHPAMDHCRIGCTECSCGKYEEMTG